MGEIDTVTLRRAEIRLAVYVASARDAYTAGVGAAEKKVSDASSLDVNREGVAGELAFCRLFNLYPDLDTEHLPEPGKPDFDVIWPGGHTVDVKTTHYPNGRLLGLVSKKDQRCDVYALMIGSMPTYRFAGFALGADLFLEGNLRDLGHGETYALDQADLSMSFPLE